MRIRIYSVACRIDVVARRLSRKTLVALLILCFWPIDGSVLAASPNRSLVASRPNIILVMTDDQGKGDLNCLGNADLATPNLDRLYQRSCRFTDFHVSPTCAPTRSAIMSGRHEFRNGVTHTILERERMSLDSVTIAEVLREVGYHTGIFGKWHLGDQEDYQPHRRGFQEVFIHGGGGIGQAYPGSCADAPPNRQNRYFDCVIRHNRKFVQTHGFCTDVFFQHALRWIDSQRGKEEPFFAYIATNAPHGPMIAPEDSKQPFLAAGFDENTASRYGMITNIDQNMGLLTSKLDEWNLTDRTLLVFMTDNGQYGGSSTRHGRPYRVHRAGLRGHKGTPYEGGTRVPAFWSWKDRLPEGQDIPALTAHLDIFPTLAEIAGANESNSPGLVRSRKQVEGRSLVPLLDAPTDSAWERRYLFVHVGRWKSGDNIDDHRYRRCAVRGPQFRLVNNSELYDIANDPSETTNLYDQQPDVVAELRAAYDKWWSDTRPLMVNEDVELAATRPFWVEYEKQKASIGIPDWVNPQFSIPSSSDDVTR